MSRIFFASFACCSLLLLVGCLAPPKRHPWQVTREDASQLQNERAWPTLSTNDYARVIDAEKTNAVALLQEHPFVPLDTAQVSAFAPDLSRHSGQAYLVRGTTYLSRPYFTIVRCEDVTGSLLVLQYTWNGELLMPIRWVAEPNALVAFLPRAPEHVYTDALLGGDGILRGREAKCTDTR